MWTEAGRRGIGIERLAGWMATGPAGLVGLIRKGSLVVGADADMMVFDPNSTSVVDVHRLHHRNPVSPYDRLELTGSVGRVWLHGADIDVDTAAGRFLAPDGSAVADAAAHDERTQRTGVGP
jgi:allantoinase